MINTLFINAHDRDEAFTFKTILSNVIIISKYCIFTYTHRIRLINLIVLKKYINYLTIPKLP